MSDANGGDSTRLFFVRHGVTDQTGKLLYGHSKGISLNVEGRHQAKLTAQYLQDLAIDVIYSSPLERAYETAEIIALDRDIQIEIKRDLIDTDVGAWTNMALDECAQLKEWQEVQDAPSQFCFPEGESFANLFSRMIEVVNEIAQSHVGRSVLIVSHRDPIISVLGNYMGVHMDQFQRIPCMPASISELIINGDGGAVQSINVLPSQRLV